MSMNDEIVKRTEPQPRWTRCYTLGNDKPKLSFAPQGNCRWCQTCVPTVRVQHSSAHPTFVWGRLWPPCPNCDCTFIVRLPKKFPHIVYIFSCCCDHGSLLSMRTDDISLCCAQFASYGSCSFLCDQTGSQLCEPLSRTSVRQHVGTLGAQPACGCWYTRGVHKPRGPTITTRKCPTIGFSEGDKWLPKPDAPMAVSSFNSCQQSEFPTSSPIAFCSTVHIGRTQTTAGWTHTRHGLLAEEPKRRMVGPTPLSPMQAPIHGQANRWRLSLLTWLPCGTQPTRRGHPTPLHRRQGIGGPNCIPCDQHGIGLNLV